LKEAVRNKVLSIDDRRSERFNPAIAGRPDLMGGRPSQAVSSSMAKQPDLVASGNGMAPSPMRSPSFYRLASRYFSEHGPWGHRYRGRCIDRNGATMLETVLTDIRYALRFLRRSPAFATVAVLSLGIGIGFNAALFSVVDALLLRPLPVTSPEQLVDIYTSGDDGDPYATSSYPDYLDFQADGPVFEGIAGHSAMIAAQNLQEGSRLALGEVVTGNYFELLGIGAAVGRTLRPEDDRPGAEPVLMVSHRYWQREMGGDPGVVGRTLRLRGRAYTVVGVAPAGFSGILPMLAAEIWLPTAQVEDVEPAGMQSYVPSPTGNTRLERRGQRWLFLKARLKPGVSVAQAQAHADVLAARLQATYPQTNKDRGLSLRPTRGVRIHPAADRVLFPVAGATMALVGLVLLIACANVASLLLARASARRREIGIRMAIGASRGRLVRQLLAESVVLALLGGLAGAGLAWTSTRALTSLSLPLPIPLSFDLRLDTRVLAFTFLVALGAGLVAGLAPALRASRPDLVSELRGETPTAEVSGRRLSFRDGLVAGQMAVTFVLLVTAGLVTRSLAASHAAKVGFETSGIAILSFDLNMLRYAPERGRQFMGEVLERIRALPGVTSVATADRLPFSLNFSEGQFEVPGHASPHDRGFTLKTTWVSSSYFETLGVPVLQGRSFTEGDTSESPRVAVINEAMVRRFWPGGPALGQHLRLRDRAGAPFEIVGVVADYRVQSIGEGSTPYVHFSNRQRPDSYQIVFARTRGDAQRLLQDMRRLVLGMEPNLAFLENQTMEAQVSATLLPVTAGTWVASVAGVVALALAGIGLYGVVAYSVARRTREIGLRMALGADRMQVLRLVLRQGLALAVIGVVAGGVLAALVAGGLSGALYGVTAADPLAWAVAASIVLVAAAGANALPALRASRVAPSEALRVD
jgi:putative ABC transport system permease protein